MARPEKNTVDYFPHFVNSGKTLFTVEQRFGNDGYAFLFKVLETLGMSENHFIDCRNAADYEFLLAKTKVSRESAEGIMELLTTLGTFDVELWKDRIIFSENFLKNIQSVYERRKRKCMSKQDLCIHLSLKCKPKPASKPLPSAETPQSKVKKSIGEKSEGEDEEISDEISPAQKAREFFKKIESENLEETAERKKFYNYWTEKNKSGTKERWELEKTFDVDRRFATWQRNALQFNSPSYGKNQRDRIRSGHVSEGGRADLTVTDDDV